MALGDQVTDLIEQFIAAALAEKWSRRRGCLVGLIVKWGLG